MKQTRLIITICFILITISSYGAEKESVDPIYSLQHCIETAWQNSTTVQRSNIQLESEGSSLEMTKANRNPDLSFNGDEKSSWGDSGSTSLSMSLNSSITIYNGAKLKSAIQQSQIGVERANVDIQTEKELLSLQVMAAYIDLLYAKEQLKNSQLQLESTKEQLEYTLERKEIGVVNLSEYLNMKSQYATDKATLIESKNSVATIRVTLMQLMNITIDKSFDIKDVTIDSIDKLILGGENDTPESIYNSALNLQPSIKSSELNIDESAYDIELAKADKLPLISANAGFGTSFNSSGTSDSFGSQLKSRATPSIGVSISIPIYQRKTVKDNITQAELQRQRAELELTDTKNDLRKSIELAYTEVQTAKARYRAATEQLAAEEESFSIAEEMFTQGLINTTDFIIIKNDLVDAENSTIQSKYQLLLQSKYLSYYKGEEINLSIN